MTSLLSHNWKIRSGRLWQSLRPFRNLSSGFMPI